RILALADGGPQIGVTPDKYVRLHSLETGLALPLKFKTGKGDEEVDRVLTTANKSWDVGLRVIGSHLYVVGSRAIVSYNLDRAAVADVPAAHLRHLPRVGQEPRPERPARLREGSRRPRRHHRQLAADRRRVRLPDRGRQGEAAARRAPGEIVRPEHAARSSVP